jgi:thymidylate synthase
LGDAHIYESHIGAVKEQIKRVPYEFPELSVSDDLTDIDDIKEEYFAMNNYKSWPKIMAPMIA